MLQTVRKGTWGLLPAGAAVLLLTVLAGKGVAQGDASDATASAGAAGVRIAVVDMATVLRTSNEWQDAVEARARMRERMTRTVDRLVREAQVLRNEMENLPPGTQERRVKSLEVEEAGRRLQQTRVDLEMEFAEQFARTTREFYRHLGDAVAAHAEENGIDLVVKKQPVELAPPDSPEESLQLSASEVLYAGRKLDISEAIVERLNAAYGAPIEVK